MLWDLMDQLKAPTLSLSFLFSGLLNFYLLLLLLLLLWHLPAIVLVSDDRQPVT
jgi:hypothetical protein